MKARMTVNGKVAGELMLRVAPSGDTLDIASDLLSPVSPNYACPFAFPGKIEAVMIDLI